RRHDDALQKARLSGECGTQIDGRARRARRHEALAERTLESGLRHHAGGQREAVGAGEVEGSVAGTSVYDDRTAYDCDIDGICLNPQATGGHKDSRCAGNVSKSNHLSRLRRTLTAMLMPPEDGASASRRDARLGQLVCPPFVSVPELHRD